MGKRKSSPQKGCVSTKKRRNVGKRRAKGIGVRYYRHYRTGKLMVAVDYGYACWPFGRKRG